MRIAITGATGMIGCRLTQFLMAQGHQIAMITRRTCVDQPQVSVKKLEGDFLQGRSVSVKRLEPDFLQGRSVSVKRLEPDFLQGRSVSVIAWDPELDYIEIEKLEGFDVIIHLAGANIGQYWSPEYKKKILESRVHSTRLLCESLARVSHKPKLLISASAVGFYGHHRPQEFLDENSPCGSGFLADVCRHWEEETKPLLQSGIRVVCMRLGLVLSKSGGALAQMRLPFQLGLGGRLGSGQQVISWIALDEIPYVVDHLIKNNYMSGPVNVVSPKAVSNARFTEILGQTFHRPTLFAVPGFVIRLFFGEMGQDLLLEGAHVMPGRLQGSGYNFRFPDLKDALKKAVE